MSHGISASKQNMNELVYKGIQVLRSGTDITMARTMTDQKYCYSLLVDT